MYFDAMQTTLRIDAATYRAAKAEAARQGMTMTRFIEEALRQQIAAGHDEPTRDPRMRAEIEERDRLMEALLECTAHFRIGTHPTRGELSTR
jgi:hypothetical protein